MSTVRNETLQQPRATGSAAPFWWATLWAPFWIGSSLPVPALPRPQRAQPVHGQQPLSLVRLLDSLCAAITTQRRRIIGLRTAWLTVALVAGWLMVGRFTSHAPAWQLLAVAITVVLLLGLCFTLLMQPNREQLARTLDRSFGLHESVATALETAQGGRPRGLPALQVLRATETADRLSTHPVFARRWPRRELLALVLMLTICLVFLVLQIPRNTPGPPSAPGGTAQGAIPGASNGTGTNGSQPQPGQAGQNDQGTTGQQGGKPTASGQRDLDTLAGALADHGVTRTAADKINQGDYPGAAQALRNAGAQASQLSPEARESLASDLRNAAGKTSDPKLAQDLRDLAEKLAGNNPGAIQSAFNQVASDIDRLGAGNQAGQQPGSGNQPAPSGQGNGQGSGSGGNAGTQLPNSQQSQQPAQNSAAPLLGADGKPIELPKGNTNGERINSQNPTAGGNRQSDPGAAPTGGGQVRQGTVGEAGVDPNQVPADQRGPVERYFTPPTENQP